jgi:hypothetical protein
MEKKYKITFFSGGQPRLFLSDEKPIFIYNRGSVLLFKDAETGNEITINGHFIVKEIKNEKNSSN